MKKIFSLMLCLALALSLIGCGKDTVQEDIADTAYTAVPKEPGAGSYMITIGKTTEDVNAGTHMLSEDETAEVMTAIALSVDENGWVNDVTNSAPSCKVLIRDLSGVSTYNYSAYDGIFNDLENMRSLKLTDEARNTVNTIFENYVSMAADEG